MEEFIAYLVKNLVDQPDLVEVSIKEKEEGLWIEMKVDKKDIAKIVGRQGRTIKALRTLAIVIGARFGRRVRLDLIQE